MATWSKTTKHSASWNKTSKNSASWSKINKSLGTNSFLLLETGFYLLLEDGTSKLILEQSNPAGTNWTKLNKS